MSNNNLLDFESQQPKPPYSTESASALGPYGYDVIPLKPGSKYPLRAGWKSSDPVKQWINAPKDANIGIRAGGSILAAFIDCDHPMTYTNAVNWLSGLGLLDYPIVKSPQGYHVYVSFSGGLHGDYRNLADEFGQGEFRYGQGAYVAAPRSAVEGEVYRYIASSLNQLPVINLADIIPILKNPEISTEPDLKHPSIPRPTKFLLLGSNLDKYASRSEAEQAILVGLANAGISFEETFELFMKHPCAGKFRELYRNDPNNAVRWLRYSWEQAVSWSKDKDSPTRLMINKLIKSYRNITWQGRSGVSDRAVYGAHLEIAWSASKLVYVASMRDLADRAGVSVFTASNSTHRLIKSGRIKLNRAATVELANIYEINPETMGITLTLPHSTYREVLEIVPPVNVSNTLDRSVWREWNKKIPFESHDLWRNKVGLGKVGCQIYWVLLNGGPLSIKELSEITGRCRKTVERRTKQMSGILDTITGELIAMVERGDDGKWSAKTDFDMDYLAEVVGSAGKGFEQRRKHDDERRRHYKQLEKIGKTRKESAT